MILWSLGKRSQDGLLLLRVAPHPVCGPSATCFEYMLGGRARQVWWRPHVPPPHTESWQVGGALAGVGTAGGRPPGATLSLW